MKLARKLMLALVLGLSFVLVAQGYNRVRREAELFDTDVRRDQRRVGLALSAGVSEVWRRDGEQAALRMVEDVNERDPEMLMRWVWLDAPTGDRFGVRAPHELVTRLRQNEEVHWVEHRADGKDRIYTYLPVRIEGARPGAIELSEPLVEERRYLRASVESTVVTTVVLSALVALMVLALGVWFVGRPVHALVEKARRVGAGDFSGRLELTQKDEIGELADEMNAMSDRLSVATEQLRKETSARLTAMEQLRHADRLTTVGKLAAGIAHELGTPLNVVAGRAAMISTSEVEGFEAAESARIIVEQSERMARIIRQLLDFGRKRAALKTSHDLRAVARQTIAMLGPLAQRRGVSLQLNERDEDATAEVDAGQIQQAITNLVVNAIDAMPTGGPLELTVRRGRATPPPDVGGDEGDYVSVAVRDRGEGIEPELLEHVFEPFYTTKDVGQGTGLGLSVSYGLVREHGGWIAVQSEQGKGSTFTIYLPHSGEATG